MSKRKAVKLPENAPGTKYTQERLFWNADEETVSDLRDAWKEGSMLSSETIPEDCLCALVLLAGWAHRSGVDIVDDYDALIQRANTLLHDTTGPGQRLQHPDLFFVSCTCILHARGEQPSIGGYVQIGVDALFEDLIGRYLE